MKTAMSHRRNEGFTLIELIIAVAIVGILAAIAYPTYVDSVRKARRAEARATLIELAQWMERNYTMAHRYDQNPAGAPINTAALPFKEAPKDGTPKVYDLTVTAPNANSFTLRAVPKGAQAGDKCGTLTLNQAGQRGVEGAVGMTAADCW